MLEVRLGKGFNVGYIVQQGTDGMGHSRSDLILEGDAVSIDNGHLTIEDSRGNVIAIYTPGKWVSVVRDGDVSWRRGDNSGGPYKINKE